jgi:hypothetical protein
MKETFGALTHGSNPCRAAIDNLKFFGALSCLIAVVVWLGLTGCSIVPKHPRFFRDTINFLGVFLLGESPG